MIFFVINKKIENGNIILRDNTNIVSPVSTMENFIASYELDFTKFQETIISTNAIVAGGAALALYLKQNNIEPGFEPNDLDIWVKSSMYIRGIGNVVFNHEFKTLQYFFKQNGYEVIRDLRINCDDIEADEYFMSMNKIARIVTLRKSEKTIQIVMVKDNNLIGYITSYFDMTQCISWWNAVDNTFYTLYPELTLNKQMNCNLERKGQQYPVQLQLRIEKYINRGFKLIELPPITKNEKDPRNFEQKTNLEDEKAFDVWEYEDVDCITFLKKSHWNIILVSGKQKYAFHRQNLIDFMEKNKLNIPNIGCVYDTPYHHSIPHIAFELIKYSDYSIYELIHKYDVNHNSHTKSISELHCYTVADWNSEKATVVISPSSIPPEFQEINELLNLDSDYDEDPAIDDYLLDQLLVD